MTQHFKEWWKWHILLPLSVRPSPSASEMALEICVKVFQALAICVYSFFFRRGHPYYYLTSFDNYFTKMLSLNGF